MDACYRVNFVTEHMFTDISSWSVRTLGNITAGNLIPFTGHFDFNGMTLKSTANSDGVFQNIGEDGIVENVKCEFTDSRLAHTSNGKIQNVQSRNTYSTNVNDTSGVLYLNNGTVSNATVWAEAKSDVTVLNYSGFGGIIFNNYGTIDNCVFYGANVESTLSGFGGISRYSASEVKQSGDDIVAIKGIISNCKTYMPLNKSVVGVGNNIGGIVTSSKGAYIENCTASLKITSFKAYMLNSVLTTVKRVGGIVGVTSGSGKITNCTTSGAIIDDARTNAEYLGGISGGAADGGSADAIKNMIIEDCESSMNVKGKNYIAGITATAEGGDTIIKCIIKKCVNRGSINGMYGVGGFIGVAYSSKYDSALTSAIKECINYGNITTDKDRGGAFIGGANNGANIDLCKNYGDILGAGTNKGGFIGAGASSGAVKISNSISYASVIASNASSSLVGNLLANDTLSSCKVKNINGAIIYHVNGAAQSTAASKIEYLSAAEIPAEKPKPEVVKTMIMGADNDNVIQYQLDFNTDLIPAGTKIYSYKISVDGGSYFTQLIHKEYVLCNIGNARIASSIEIGTGEGQYSRLTFSYIAPTTEGKCMVLIRLSNNREYYL